MSEFNWGGEHADYKFTCGVLMEQGDGQCDELATLPYNDKLMATVMPDGSRKILKELHNIYWKQKMDLPAFDDGVEVIDELRQRFADAACDISGHKPLMKLQDENKINSDFYKRIENSAMMGCYGEIPVPL